MLAVILLGLFTWFRWATHSIANRMQAPQLHIAELPSEDFSFQTLEGKSLRLSEMKGKVLFVDLWGTWCVQCVAEMPAVQKLYNQFRSDPRVQFLIISRMDSEQRVRQFAARNGYSLPFYVMKDEDIPETMRLNQFPSTFLYNKRGTLVAQHVGAADWSASSVVNTLRRLEQ